MSEREPPKTGLVDLPLKSRRRAVANLSLFEGELAGAGDALSSPPPGAPPGASTGAETRTRTATANAAENETENLRSVAPEPMARPVLQLDLDEVEDSESVSAGGQPQAPPAGSTVMRGAADHFLAGLADAAANLGVVAAAVVGMSLLGLDPDLDQWPGFLGFLLIFSFFYLTVPLAFWGKTAGMAWRGLRARDVDGRPLAFRQTAIRWIAAWLAALLAGVPALVVLSGRSFPDRLSRSRTVATD